ncbi:HAMP domain-containing sensor histidine kinase [Streptomyces sp. NPDC000594]|uniref:HAMP domain-containing sensor histidine kinase n=1 Tax=Streptomyces sp. NPDC000594 TaxID=3154261 RepID=UPI0033320F4E
MTPRTPRASLPPPGPTDPSGTSGTSDPPASRTGAPLRRLMEGLPLQLAAVVAIAAFLLAGGLGLLTVTASGDQRLELNRALLAEQLESAAYTYARVMVVTETQVAIDDPRLPAGLRRETAHRQELFTQLVEGDRGPVLWAVTYVGGHSLSIRSDYRRERAADERFARTVLWLATGSATVVSLAGLLLARPMSARLRRVARTARRIADGHLDARIGPVPGAREITELAASVDKMAATLQDRLRIEQRFAADVTHELRTPAAGLLAAAEILPESHETDLVRGRVEALCELVEDLLEVSRLGAGVDSVTLEPHRLAEPLHRVVLSTGLPCTVVVDDDSTVLTDPRRLARIVANLLANAHRHGAPPVVLGLDRGTITVRDHGPGYPPDLLAEGPRPFRTGTAGRGRGSGLGLTIAEGHARLIRAELAFDGAPGGGARAVLRLPLDAEPPPPPSARRP